MAITITQHPGSNVVASNSDILFVVAGYAQGFLNYSYVCDIVDQDGNTTRIKQRPNPSGFGVFNLRNIINPDISWDSHLFNTNITNIASQPQMFAGAEGGLARYKITFGEEYDVNGTLTLYDGTSGNGVVGEGENVLGDIKDDYYYCIKRALDINVETDFYWDIDDHYVTTPNDPGDAQCALTDMPRTGIKVRPTDYHATAFLNGPKYSGSADFNDIYKLEFDYFDELDCQGNELTIFNESHYNAIINQGSGLNPVAPRGTFTETWDDDLYLSFFESSSGNYSYKNQLTYAQLNDVDAGQQGAAKSFSVTIMDKTKDYSSKKC